jgi:hypothetical protein
MYLACIGVVVAVLLAGCGVSDRDIGGRRGGPPPRPSAGTSGSAGAGSGAAGFAGTIGQDGGGGGVVGGSGTGSTGDPGGSGGTPVPAEFDAGSAPDRNDVVAGELCDRFATIQCAGEGRCCSSAGRSFDTCKSDLLAVCNSQLFLDQIAMNPKPGFSPTATRRVLDELERLAAECNPAFVTFMFSPQGLPTLFPGTIPPQGSCRPDNVLSNVQWAAAVTFCTTSETHACLPMTWTCTPRGGVGAPCFLDSNCIDGHYCPNPDPNPAGASCLARKPDGASCARGNECLSLFCMGGQCVFPNAAGAFCPQ